MLHPSQRPITTVWLTALAFEASSDISVRVQSTLPDCNASLQVGIALCTCILC